MTYNNIPRLKLNDNSNRGGSTGPSVASDDNSSVSGLSVVTHLSGMTPLSNYSKNEVSFSFSRLLKTIIRCLNHNIDTKSNLKQFGKDRSLSFDSCM